MRILFVSALFILNTIQLFAQQSHAFPAFKEAPLREVLLYLETNFDVLFSYRDNNIEEESISLETGNYTLKSYLPLVFNQTRLGFKFIDEHHLILTKKKSGSENFNRLCGYVKDKNNGQFLPFANVLIKGKQKGATTSQNGRFELDGVSIGDTLIFSYVGYQSLQVIISQNEGTNCPTFNLDIQELEMDPVIVTVYLMDGILQDYKSQKVLIKPEKLSIFPGSVEPDIMTSIQMLPGVFSADETASGLNIRGGTPDQNLVLYDGIPVYHTGHFFGMISAFNPYIVKEVNVYRSGMGSEFGGRVSGVIDIHSDDAIPKKFELGLGLNMIHGHINSKFPVTKKSGITVSLRRSFTDFWSTPTFLRYAEKVFQGTKLEDEQVPGASQEPKNKFFFSDFNFKWVWKAGKNRFGLDMFSGFNGLDYTTEIPEFGAFTTDTVKLENIGTSLYWNRDWSNNFSTEMNLTDSRFNYSYDLSLSPLAFPNLIVARFSSGNTLHDEGFNWKNIWKPQKNHQVRFGYQYTQNSIELNFSQTGINGSPPEDQEFRHRLHTLFGEYHLALADILDLDLGVRYQRQPILKNSYFEPRVALTARINPYFKLKLSSSKQFQFVSQLVILDFNEILFGDKIWVASDTAKGRSIPVIESNQWTGGLLFSKNDWQIDLEGYVKELAGITSLSSSFGNIPEQPYSKGNSRIRGIDVLVKKQFNEHYRSWLSYSLSQSVYEFPDLDANVFPASHDQRHTLQWVHLYIAKPWEFSLGWQLGSGLPFTKAIGTDVLTNPSNPLDSIPFIIYGDRNDSRLKPYHRLDASVMYNFKKEDKFIGFAGLSLINIYDQTNVLGKQFLIGDFNTGNETYELLTIDKRGLKFTPNLVFRIQW